MRTVCAVKRSGPAGRRRSATAAERRSRLRRGAFAEIVAAIWLMLKGYRILAWRHRSRLGELDLIAVRGRRIAFIEVKRRRTTEAAQASINTWQSNRIAAAAEQWVWQHPRYREHEIGLDAILIARWRPPLHAVNALQPV